MTDPTPDPIPTPDPSELPSIDQPVLDLGREVIRQFVLNAVADFSTQILTLRSDFTGAQSVLAQLVATVTAQATALAQAQTAITALQTAVAALQPPAPTP